MDVRARNIETVKTFLSLLEQEKIQEFIDLFSENGKQTNPYGSGIFPDSIVGKDALFAFWEPVPARFDGMQFPLKELMPLLDENKILATFTGKIKLKDGAGYYNNDYFCLFHFDTEGKIIEYTEIFNPITVVRAFGLKDQV